MAKNEYRTNYNVFLDKLKQNTPSIFSLRK